MSLPPPPLLALDDRQRKLLESAITRLRSELEDDLAAQLEGTYGIYEDRPPDPESALRLDPSALQDRRELADVVRYLEATGAERADAVRRLVREATFTHLNRLVAIRIAEALDLLPPSLAAGRESAGFRNVLEVAPLLRDDRTGGYWTYLRLCGDELAADAPVLFDPRNPLLALAPSPKTLDAVLAELSDSALADIWSAPDALGWTYQFFNTGDERRQMRAESGAPRNSRELAVRNQFFTPRYVVDFLVQNTLGRRLMEADPTSLLLADLPLLIDPPTEKGEPLALEDVRMLDPAVGSGHFLLGGYDLLERAWELAGVPPAESAARILPCLWGIDIDPRCAQVASAALVLRARRHCKTGPLPRPNIVTARALPEGEEVWTRVLADLPPTHRQLVQRMRAELAQAPLLGSLLKVEEALAEAIHQLVPATDASLPLFGHSGIDTDAFHQVEAEVLAALQRIADETTSTAAERLLAAEAGDAIWFVEALRQRYDAVLMNPPFGEPVAETKGYLKAGYPWIPTKDYNLLAAFVGRGLQLCRGTGYLGAITSRTGFFLRTFEAWRRDVILRHSLATFADLGSDVMQSAMVEAAAYVVSARLADAAHTATFVRLLKETDQPTALANTAAELRATGQSPLVIRVPTGGLALSAGAEFAYWDPSGVGQLFAGLPRIEGHAAEVRQGLVTADDFRFVRTFWEVDSRRIARSRAETFEGKRWVPFAKGGEYSPYYGDIHLVVEWEEDGRRIRETGRDARVQNTQYYFRPGLTWPSRTVSAFAPQALPEGAVFSPRGPLCVPMKSSEALGLLAWLSSRVVRFQVEASAPAGEETKTGGTAARDYTVGMIQNMPWPAALGHDDDICQLCALIIEKVRMKSGSEETARTFAVPDVMRTLPSSGTARLDRSIILYSIEDAKVTTEVLDGHRAIDDRILTMLAASANVSEALAKAAGPLVATFNETPLSVAEEEEFISLYGASMPDVIEAVTKAAGMARFMRLNYHVVNRRLELLAMTFQRHPTVLVDVIERRRLLPPEEPKQSTESLLSYLVGTAFGRWDVRIGRDPSLAPALPGVFDPVPVCSPGMLVGAEGLPVHDAPPGYPLALPPGRVLLDEAGHAWDIEARVRAVAAVLFDDSDAILAEAVAILGVRSLRDYFRRQFFKDHLSRYSKSRRKAPIYWQLSVLSRAWSVWVYAPVLARDTLFAVQGEAARRERLAEETIRRLHAEREAGGAGRTVKAVDAELAAEQELAEELGRFRAEAERVAALGWTPDLDDGIILCAAPLAGLFPAWPDAAVARGELRAGKYAWAGVSAWAGEL